MLFIISTPIGNLKDISFRAIETINECDYILVEDTRRTGILFQNYNIKKKMISYNDTNKERKTKHIIEDLKHEKKIAILSDSGTPGISDPGFYLVRECNKNNIEVSPIPGANAAVSALVCSGLPTDRFSFYGFFPKKKSKQEKLISTIDHTIIFYESPHRIKKTLKLFSEKIPEMKCVIARELTKKFEEFITGTTKEVFEKIETRNVKGEITIILSPN